MSHSNRGSDEEDESSESSEAGISNSPCLSVDDSGAVPLPIAELLREAARLKDCQLAERQRSFLQAPEFMQRCTFPCNEKEVLLVVGIRCW